MERTNYLKQGIDQKRRDN